MSIKANQIAEEPIKLASQASAPATGAGTGIFFALDIGASQTEGAFADESGNIVQLTDSGILNLAENSISDLADVTTAGITDGQILKWVSANNRFEPSNEAVGSGEANTASNAGAAATADIFKAKVGVDLQFRRLLQGANVTLTQNADSITIAAAGSGTDADAIHDNVAGEIAALTEKLIPVSADLLIIEDSAAGNAKKKIQIGNLPGGSSNLDYSFNLAAGATIATRIAGATNVPGGWTIEAADTAGITQLGTSADTLTITHNLGQLAVEIAVFEETTAGPASLQGITKIDLTAQGDQKNTLTLDECGVIDLQTKTNSSKSLIVTVKFAP